MFNERSPHDCCAGEGPSGRARPTRSVLGLVATVAAVLAPKCPVCLAVYLSAWGLGMGAAEAVSRVAPLLLPVGVALGLLALVSLGRALWRARRPTHP